MGASGAARGSAALGQAALLILLARDVGPAMFGTLAVFFSLQAVVFPIAGMNTPTFVAREYAKGSVETALASMRTNRVVVTAAFVLTTLVTAPLWGSVQPAAAIAANGLSASADNVSDNRLAVSYAQRRAAPAVVVIVARSVVALTVYLVLLAMSWGALEAFSLAKVASAIVSISLSRLTVKTERLRRVTSTRQILRQQFGMASALWASSLRNFDVIILSAVAGVHAAGLYAAASRAITPFWLVPASINPVLVPSAVGWRPEKATKLIRDLYVGLVLLSVVTLAFGPFAERGVTLVLGADYAGAGILLILISLRIGPVAVGPVIAGVLQARGFEKYVGRNSLIVALLTLMGAYIGALIGGAAGAAVVIAVVALFGSTRLWLTGRKLLMGS
ncbi:hypothetical protein [Blastococcus sp. TF02-09]|uniref:hypothetical protein n=1 Tax=Blastococcus sp. TF02-09 TaxID=2250576 RepID=UPI0011BE331D|nr:hypothetical protein [Blastococcus sp. TF02-9]